MTSLTEEQKLSFIRDGYIILPQIVSIGLIQAALAHCDAAYAANHYNTPKHDSGVKPTPSFWRSVKSARPVTDLFYESGLMQVAEQLLGASNVDILNDDGQIAYTLPNPDSELSLHEQHPKQKWHIDTPLGEYINRGADFVLIVGVALSEGQEVDENRGQFTVWPGRYDTMDSGSHLITHATMREVVETEAAEHVISTFKSRKADVGMAERVLVKSGDAFIAHQRLAHAPGVNAWSEIRKNIYFRVRHKNHDDLLDEFSLAAAPWVGFEGIADAVESEASSERMHGHDRFKVEL
ncbi:hypothetical protein FGB62_7g01 [Gracilaria domingensis]|nr:hypothetical protein FGB62_7g01 [Gracilaria domingensis]